MKNSVIQADLTETIESRDKTVFKPIEFSEAWEVWIEDRAKSTQDGYTVTVKSFLSWALDNGIDHPERSDIVAYREYLLTPHPSRKNGALITFSADTAARYFRGVKMFFSFLEDQGLYRNVTKNVRSPKTKPTEFKRDYLEREDVLTILRSINRSSERGKRDYALVLAIISCAFRIVELQRADIGDIEKRGSEWRLYIQGKGHLEKDTYKKIEPELRTALADYLRARKVTGKNEPLFASVGSNCKPGGERLTVPSLSRIIKTILIEAGYNSPRLTAHSLRHTSITLDRQAGGSLEEASRHARHSNINITQRYDHLLEKREAHDEKRILNYLFTGATESGAADTPP